MNNRILSLSFVIMECEITISKIIIEKEKGVRLQHATIRLIVQDEFYMEKESMMIERHIITI